MYTVLVVLLVAAAMILVECKTAKRNWPRVPGWWLRAALLNTVQIGSVFLAGIAWDRWFPQARLWSAESLGYVAGGILGYFVITFFYYWWHRWRHEYPFLWRWFHQLHHSPQRIEIITSFYKHPFEIICNSILSSFIVYVIVGLTAEQAALAVLLSGLAELFYHWNVVTPYWLGFVFQRPESHCVHHQEGIHSHNFSDLPLWDILFGTFRNPTKWEARCGFGDGEHRFKDMIYGVDIHKHKKNG